MHENWVFGYGSLMWNPGFRFIERQRAVIHGYHRSLCMLSHMYRGTPDRPGLVLGLDIGGACHGIAFRVADEDWADASAYLRAREQVTNMYHEVVKPVRLVGKEAEKVPALTYAVDRTHRQYAGRLSFEDQLHHVRQGHGQSGSCTDYVLNTVQHLREAGIRDQPLERLAQALLKMPAKI
ncbi:gamma-glutamylcyclotransferase [Aestuariivirga sp. YIM B02566]|uniref:Gamma-glutamylcyclotransferase n=1 Tax=Taklimakanibacter albus TaxID=2800327 RepID=A0ACC5QWV8_9HYPH|nr:gamma-glutamylcyclotransferase [Aestuariivirga sp. YIM B02566]MBK1864832.1 gamma-glutamylcyclotransferase [Aestuariivirga sp. YIM B02566]